MAQGSSPATLEAVSDFEDRHTFLWLVLGIRSMLVRLDGVLERHGQAQAFPATVNEPEDHLALDAVLGLVALGGALRGHIERLAGPDDRHTDTAASHQPATPRHLRDLLA